MDCLRCPDVPVAVLLEDTSPAAMELATGFKLSPYFSARLLTSMPEARELMLDRKVDGIVRIRPEFSSRLMLGNAEVQILIYGTDANRARIIQGYAEGTIGQWTARRSAEGKDVAAGPVVVQNRLWFNDADESRYFLVPGLIVLIMTLIGALLTALRMAREWERGTLESLFVTPIRSGEILLGKTVPYFILGLIGLALCIFAAQYFFDVPLRGSITVLLALDAVSARRARHWIVDLLGGQKPVRRQPSHSAGHVSTGGDACGFLFDIRSMPVPVRITYILPARYYVALLQTVFLAGDVWSVILQHGGAGRDGVVLWIWTRAVTRKQLS